VDNPHPPGSLGKYITARDAPDRNRSQGGGGFFVHAWSKSMIANLVWGTQHHPTAFQAVERGEWVHLITGLGHHVHSYLKCEVRSVIGGGAGDILNIFGARA
jgi:hypothetical protein